MTQAGMPPLDFFVIGAMKAATTWLQAQMSQHPDIFVPEIEPHYFTREYERGTRWYRDLFPAQKADGTLWGEKTADYLATPEAAQRISKTYPDAKLIVQLRNPVDRAYADYKMLFRRGTVKGLPQEYMTSLDSEQPRFLNNGMYAAHLRRWLELFPAENLLVFTFEDVRDHPGETLARVFNHLGATVHHDPEAVKRKYNDSSKELLPLPIRKMLAPLKPMVRPYRNSSLFRATRDLFAKQVAYPPLTDDLRNHLIDFYSRDLAELGDLLDRDFSPWLQSKREKSPVALTT